MQSLNLHIKTDGSIPVVAIQSKPFIITGPTVPTDATAGYLPGCIFMKNASNGVGSTMYVNEGTLASCDFNAK